jgi:flagellar basal-body rod modification protein FlgD
MDPVSATTATPATTTPTSAAESARTAFGSNFDTFLTLLTTQLKNQDPLSPMDSSQFTQQLVQFSQVEQSINANQNLEALISLTKGRATSDAVGYLGKTVTLTDGTGGLKDGAAHWAYTLQSGSDTTRLTITNSAGHVVYAADGATASGAHDFVWNGKDSTGRDLPNGAYTLSVAAKSSDGTSITTSVSSQGVVDEVNLTGSEPTLMIGALSVPISKATLISAQ